MKKLSTGLARLKKLSTHLKRGKLGHTKFDFSRFNATDCGQGKCGSAGCAIGECPIVFPRQWKFAKQWCSTPVLRRVNHTHPFSAAEKFFKLGKDACLHLFSPHCQITGQYGGKHLDNSATASEVAANIDAFIKTQKHK